VNSLRSASSRSILAALCLALAACGGSGGSGGDMMPDPPLELDGEYQIAVDTGMDTCGFGTGSSETPIEVSASDMTSAIVDIPLGGLGGSCAPGPFDRMDNRLFRTVVSQQSVGTCVVDTTTTTVLDFFSDGSVSGSETTTLTPVGGDCSLFGGECTLELTLDGGECAGCFACTPPGPVSAQAPVEGAGFSGGALTVAAPLATSN
jgi:hypothetical protein